MFYCNASAYMQKNSAKNGRYFRFHTCLTESTPPDDAMWLAATILSDENMLITAQNLLFYFYFIATFILLILHMRMGQEAEKMATIINSFTCSEWFGDRNLTIVTSAQSFSLHDVVPRTSTDICHSSSVWQDHTPIPCRPILTWFCCHIISGIVGLSSLTMLCELAVYSAHVFFVASLQIRQHLVTIIITSGKRIWQATPQGVFLWKNFNTTIDGTHGW